MSDNKSKMPSGGEGKPSKPTIPSTIGDIGIVKGGNTLPTFQNPPSPPPKKDK
ncbi:hypothetical protein D3C86_1838220 [compost metagenome]